ncbi:Alpha-actinin, sarcomeric [Mizuhopecten yessoensis]|uniref:Alpha-actinin, sarcomeric n=1 Tax=Mizuhopecten yessoensis TaxID=6573 RepID=A0A210QSR8_MIZYE|nr:Alpha-actinin, sarcomeric [Mizuhopecten yessoensis]
MSVLQVYLSWANSILRDAGQEMRDIGEIQQGEVLCQLIDNLDSTAGLVRQQQLKGCDEPGEYIQAAINHMRENGIKVSFGTQDLLDKDVKSMLDALWLIILNYCIHPIERGVFQRSVGIAKKYILEWCQGQLEADFDPRNTLAYNLCTGDWFIKLLQKHTGISSLPQEEKADQVKTLLEAADEKLSIEQGIVNPSEVVDGTIDEHTLMIYISLLQRKVGGNENVQNGDHRPDISEQGLVQTSDLHRIPNGHTDDDQLSAYSGSISATSGYSPSDSDRKDRYIDRRSPSHDRSTTSGYSGISGQSDSDRRERGSERLTDSFDRKQRKFSPGSPGLQRPRSHRIIMAETKGKLDAEQRKKEREEAERQRQEEDERRRKARLEMSMSRDMGGNPGNRVSGGEERRIGEGISSLGGSSFGGQPQMTGTNPQFFSGMGGVPIFVMPGQGPQAMLLLQALQQARQEANYHDQDKYVSSEQTLPKLHTLLDLDGVDEYSPIITANGGESLEYIKESPAKVSGFESPRRESPRRESPRRESPRRESPRRESPRRESPRRESPRRESPRPFLVALLKNRRESPGRQSPKRAGSPEFRPSKRGILEVVNDPLEFKGEALDLSTTGSEAEQRRFPRVDLTEPVKAIREREKNSPRDRSRSKSPRERRSLTPGTSDNEDMTDRSQEEETTPKSILRNKLSSPERASRKDKTISGGTFEKLRPDRSPSCGRRSSPDRSSREQSSGERSPAYPLSDGEEASGRRDNSPGRSTNTLDPNKRLVRVLNRELELLRLKMDVLERANMSEDTDLENLESVTTQLSEKVKETLSKATSSPRRRQSPESHRGRKSPDYDRGRMFLKKGSFSPPRSHSDNRPSRRSRSPEQTLDSPRSHSVGDKIQEDLDGQMTFSPRGKPISLGYSSPIRNVSEEIWGVDLSDLDAGFDPDRTRKWKKLASMDHVTDRDAVQLKQGLASAVSEIDILQAKLKNANAEIQTKMSRTSDVLNDCRSHLGKSQAENMELRTQLEKERTRNDTLENRIRDVDGTLHAAKSANDDLEAELEQTRGLLKGASKKDIPTLQSLTEERDQLLGVLAGTQKENTRLGQTVDQNKKRIRKGQTTVNDLRGILDEAIKERRQLYDEIKRLQTEGQLSQVSGIIGKYMEKGLYEIEERQQHLNGYITRSRSNSDISQPSASDLQEEEVPRPVSPNPVRRSVSPANVSKQSYPKRSTSPPSRLYPDSVERVRKLHGLAPVRVTSNPNKSSSLNMSGISSIHPGDDEIDDEYDYEDISPSVPSNFREIYPHRRSRSYRNNFSSSAESDGRRSPSDYDDMEVQKLMAEQQQPIGRLDFDKDLDDTYLTRAPKKDFHHHRSRSPGRSKSPGAMDISEIRDHCQPVRRRLNYNSPKHNTGGDTSNKMYLAKHDGRELIESLIESPVDNRFRDVSPRDTTPPARSSKLDVDVNNSNKIFIEALNSAVQQENGKRYFDDFDIESPKSPMDTRNTILSSDLGQEKQRQRPYSPGLKSILKSTKGEQNLSIKESSPQRNRSFYSRSISPVRSPRSVSPRSPRSRSPKNSSIGKPVFGGGAPKQIPSDRYFDDRLSSPRRFMSPSTQYHHNPL